MTKERDDAVFWIVVGVIVLLSAFTWWGTEAGVWTLEFPFWPSMFIWFGIGITISSIRKLRSPEADQNENFGSWC